MLPFYDEAVRAEEHVPTADKIEISMFVDGSFHADTNTGGFAVVYKQFAPDSTTEQELVQVAYQMCPCVGSMDAELCAVAESLVIARQQIVKTVKALVAASPGSPVLEAIMEHAIFVNIFSDCCRNLEFFAHPDWEIAQPVSRIKAFQRCFLESHKVLDIPEFPGLTVNLNLSWVPAHRRYYEVDLHDIADKAANRARKKGSHQTIGHMKKPVLKLKLSRRDSVYGPLQRYFVADAARPSDTSPEDKKRLREDVDAGLGAEGGREAERPSDSVQPERKKQRIRMSKYDDDRSRLDDVDS